MLYMYHVFLSMLTRPRVGSFTVCIHFGLYKSCQRVIPFVLVRLSNLYILLYSTCVAHILVLHQSISQTLFKQHMHVYICILSFPSVKLMNNIIMHVAVAD